jgi:DNA polymerase-3 subunit beta
VQAVGVALQERTPRPVLQHIHFDIGEGIAVLSATDLELAVRCSLKANSTPDTTGQGLIHGTRLAALLRDSVAEEVTISFDGPQAELRAGRSSFKLSSQDVADYPHVPTFAQAAVSVDASEFATLVRRSVFAVASEQGRYAIDGVAVSVNEGVIELAGTDGNRLAVARGSALGGGSIPQVIVPTKVLSTIRKLCESEEKIEFAVDGGLLMARAGAVVVAGSLIDGAFPRYTDMLPKPSTKVLRVSAAALAAGLRQAEHLTAEDSKAVTFTVAEGVLRLQARSAAVGEASIEIPAEYPGEALTTAFRARFILEAMSELEGDELLIEIEGAGRPAVIRAEGFAYVVAPVRVRPPKEEQQAHSPQDASV